ncbi:MAG: sensor histidine kinase [Betaproteobacteria bacterium]
MRRTRTLRSQLIGWLAVPLLVLWLLSTLVDYDIAKRFVNLAYDRQLLEAALDIGRNIKHVENQIYIDLPDVALQMLQSREYDRLYYLVIGPNNEYISGEPDLPALADPSTDRVRYYEDLYRGREIRAVAVRVPVEPGTGRGAVMIHVAERLTVRGDSARQIMLGMVVPQGLLILAATLAVWYGIARGLRPLAKLRSEVESRSHRDLSALSAAQAPQELQPLINAMNGLLARLSAVLAAQQRFIADAAHQLRTPLAGIKTQTELALRNSKSQDLEATLRQLHTATENTTRLVNQLLSLARAEPGEKREHATQPLDLATLARETTMEWVPRAIARDIDLGFDAPDAAATIDGNAFLLKEMLNNVLDNALRYTQDGGQVTVRVAPDTSVVKLAVEDTGPGIPAAERERVFERFYRVLETGSEGCGLGLAIVREIAQSHNAEIALDSGPNGVGTTVQISFPRAARMS